MDVASPLIEYVNSGRMMSMDEISEIIKVVRSAEKYKANADRLAEALQWYAEVHRCADPIKKRLPNLQGYASNIECLPCGVCHYCIARAALAAHKEGRGMTVNIAGYDHERYTADDIKTARSGALKEAVKRVTEAWLTTDDWKDDITLAVVRTAILADKQESE